MTIHNMKLNTEPFKLIKQGKKTIELRLYDDKRQKIHIGDIIIFENISDISQKLKVSVKGLYVFNDFKELYNNLDKVSIGYDEREIANYYDMEKYYSTEDIKRYGVIGIEIEVIK